jgi:hypothetical protein
VTGLQIYTIWILKVFYFKLGTTHKVFDTFHHKVDFINKVDDIEKSFPKTLHFQSNKAEYNLSNRDIEGSIAKCCKFQTNRSPSNPLEPKYKLPEVEYLPEEIPKFIRDSIDIKDIDGARPKKYFKWKTREGMFGNDIEGSSPKIRKERKADNNYNNFDYSDVTNSRFKSNRCTNPLDPLYEFKNKNG